ncbi:MAG: Crp/Fnr family transcriptional regulator [Cytophagales bacterium]|nr:Crp/Fnr family transcriptional regulator [Cytophagales bacterium]
MIVLQETLGKRYGITEEDVERILPLFEQVNFPKHSFLIQSNEISKNLFYISKGLVKEFYTFDEINDEDNITQFMKEGDFYFSINSFLENKPSDTITQVLEHSKIYILSLEKMQEYKKEIPGLQILTSQVCRDCLLRLSSRINIFMKSRKAKDRYNFFLEANRELNNRLSDKNIASYLQINSSTLSRIRTAPYTAVKSDQD